MSENGFVNRDQFLSKALERRETTVPLPDGSQIKLKAPTSQRRIAQWDTWGARRPDKNTVMPLRAFQLCAVNPDGSQMFEDTDEDFKVVCEIATGWGEDVALAAIDLISSNVEEAVKN